MYEKGRGVPQNDKEAVKWYRKAVEQGNASAALNLGVMYGGEDHGVTKDYVEADKWFIIAGTQRVRNAELAQNMIEKEMTPDQIAEAQKLARKWIGKFNEQQRIDDLKEKIKNTGGPEENANLEEPLKESAAFSEDPKLNIGVEIFTVSPGIITTEKRGVSKVDDNSGVSNTSTQKQFNAGNNITATQNSQKIEKRKIKVPSSKASRVLRDTESAYLAVRLKQLLDKTEEYGMVHVIPASKGNGNNVVFSSTAFDYVIRTEILKSDGYRVEFRVRYYSSVNGFKEPIEKKTLSTTIPESAYVGREDAATGVEELENDPYNFVLERIVSVLNEKVKDEQIMYPVKRHQELTLAWYGHEVLPDAFKDYRITKKREGYVVDPAPDPANPFVGNVIKMHRCELMFLNEFGTHFISAANDVEGPYLLWRRDTRKAQIAYMDLKDEIKKAKKKAFLQMIIIKTKEIPLGLGTDSKTIGLILMDEIIKLLMESMIEKDGRITVPNLRTLLKNNDLGEIADRLEDYNEQLAVQAVAVESLKEEFYTISKPVVSCCRSKTYNGKIDEVFKKFKEDLRKEYSEETGFVR